MKKKKLKIFDLRYEMNHAFAKHQQNLTINVPIQFIEFDTGRHVTIQKFQTIVLR